MGIGAAVASIGAYLGVGTAAAATAGTVGTIAAADAAYAAVATAPAWLSAVGTIGTIASGIGGVVSAVGAIESANAQASASTYNAKVDAQNAQQATMNAHLASEAGAQQAMNQSLKTRAALGGIIANEAASGVDVNTGSSPLVRMSEHDLGQYDALTLRSNAAKEAYGYETQASSYQGSSQLQTQEAKNDKTAGIFNAGSTLLSSAGAAADNYTKFQLSGGFSA